MEQKFFKLDKNYALNVTVIGKLTNHTLNSELRFCVDNCSKTSGF